MREVKDNEEKPREPNNHVMKVSVPPPHDRPCWAMQSAVSTSQLTEALHLFIVVRGIIIVPGWDKSKRKYVGHKCVKIIKARFGIRLTEDHAANEYETN